MRPTKEGGVVLENKKEMAIALSTLTASMHDIGVGGAAPEDHERIRVLSSMIADVAEKRLSTVRLDGSQTRTLREACGIAAVHTQVAWEVTNSIHNQTKMPQEEVLEIMNQSGDDFLEYAYLITQTGSSATPLLDMLIRCADQTTAD